MRHFTENKEDLRKDALKFQELGRMYLKEYKRVRIDAHTIILAKNEKIISKYLNHGINKKGK